MQERELRWKVDTLQCCLLYPSVAEQQAMPACVIRCTVRNEWYTTWLSGMQHTVCCLCLLSGVLVCQLSYTCDQVCVIPLAPVQQAMALLAKPERFSHLL